MFAIRKLSTTISHTFFEFLKTLFEVLNESDRKLTNTYVNNQKCHKHFQYTKEKEHLNRCRKHVSDRRPPIKWNSKWKYWSEKLVYWKKNNQLFDVWKPLTLPDKKVQTNQPNSRIRCICNRNWEPLARYIPMARFGI